VELILVALSAQHAQAVVPVIPGLRLEQPQGLFIIYDLLLGFLIKAHSQ
jgi:hypothetical protein